MIEQILARKKAIDSQITRINKQLQATSIFDRKQRKKLKQLQIKALEEGERDLLTTDVTRSLVSSEVVNKNNYKIYSTKVKGAYEMYNSNSDYGGELCKGVVETRIAFIAGEGVSVVAKKPKTQEFIDNFMKVNKLHGSNLMEMITIGELEGKNLLVLEKGSAKVTTKAGRETKEIVRVKSLKWQDVKYNIEGDKDNYIKATYKPENAKQETIYKSDRFVYVHLGGTDLDVNIANSRLHNILTDIENYSRAKYDLRENTHLFGKYSPYFKTQTGAEAKAINNELEANPWEPGTSYAGSAEFRIVEPTGSAADSIIKDMLNALKMVSLKRLTYP